MKKTLIITIMVDNVELADLGEIQEAVEAIFEDYEFKRINTQIQDEPLVIRQR